MKSGTIVKIINSYIPGTSIMTSEKYPNLIGRIAVVGGYKAIVENMNDKEINFILDTSQLYPINEQLNLFED